MEVRTEFLAVELKRLVGRGAHPKRLVLCPELRRLSGVTDETPVLEAGYIVRRYLTGAIDSLSGSHNFDGREVEANFLRRALRVLLKVEGTGQDAPVRRMRAMVLLKVYRSVDQWRKPFDLEQDLMNILADWMTSQTHQN